MSLSSLRNSEFESSKEDFTPLGEIARARAESIWKKQLDCVLCPALVFSRGCGLMPVAMGVLDKLNPENRKRSGRSATGLNGEAKSSNAGGASKSPSAASKSPSGGDSSSPEQTNQRPAAPLVLRDAKGRMLPGQTLNPGGRPKGVEVRFRELLERRGGEDQRTFEEWVASIACGEIPADTRIRWEMGRWMHERANGKALERSQNVNLSVGQGEAAPVGLERLSATAKRELLEAMGTPQELPAGDPQGPVVEGEFRAADLPATDPVDAKAAKT